MLVLPPPVVMVLTPLSVPTVVPLFKGLVMTGLSASLWRR